MFSAWIHLICTPLTCRKKLSPDRQLLAELYDVHPQAIIWARPVLAGDRGTVEELKRSNESLEEFAYAPSHDLKGPVRKIRVFSERLKQQLTGKITKNQLYFVDRVETAARRMEQLVDELLAYSHGSLGTAEREKVDLIDKRPSSTAFLTKLS